MTIIFPKGALSLFPEMRLPCNHARLPVCTRIQIEWADHGVNAIKDVLRGKSTISIALPLHCLPTDTSGLALRLTGDSLRSGELIPWRGEDLRHASSCEDADGFLGRCASAACGGHEECQPEPTPVVPRGHPRRDEPDRGGAY